jgi:hypothetical protein
VVALGKGSSSSSSVTFTGSGDPNFNPSNTRYTGGPITGLTVKELTSTAATPPARSSATGWCTPRISSQTSRRST